jgi:hypothetical protein
MTTSQNAYGDKAGMVMTVDRIPKTPMTTAIHQVMTFGGLSLMRASVAILGFFPVGAEVGHQVCPVANGQPPERRTRPWR